MTSASTHLTPTSSKNGSEISPTAAPTNSPNRLDLATLNQKFDRSAPSELIEWAADTFGSQLVMSTSFGIQAAVMLGLVTRIIPNIPVIWIDTGYLPAETYRFAEQLSKQLSLNLKVYQSPISPARMEALYGRLWEGSVDDFNRYDRLRKVEPMQRALQELNATAWLTGLRAKQTDYRKTLNKIGKQQNRYKILPILNWNAKDVYEYLTANNLPYHPYFDRGYVSVGDWHSSRPLTADDTSGRATRFNGLKQECGLHIPQTPEEAESLNSSSL